jgi:TonB family protein
MGSAPRPGTLLEIDLIKERYSRSFVASVAIHCLALVLFVIVPYIFPSSQTITIGSGMGGGSGGDPYTVGVADEFKGGLGMTKPSLIPQPPALPEKREEKKPEAVEIPDTIEKKKPRPTVPLNRKKTPPKKTNAIPTEPEPGAGGTGGIGGGSGGGMGGGVGISIGAGTGGLGNSWYARAVESRIGSNWIKPVDRSRRIEIVYSFVVANDGTIYNIRKVKSSGNEALDQTAERAIRTSNPLAPPPPELRSRRLEFAAQFIYPP